MNSWFMFFPESCYWRTHVPTDGTSVLSNGILMVKVECRRFWAQKRKDCHSSSWTFGWWSIDGGKYYCRFNFGNLVSLVTKPVQHQPTRETLSKLNYKITLFPLLAYYPTLLMYLHHILHTHTHTHTHTHLSAHWYIIY